MSLQLKLYKFRYILDVPRKTSGRTFREFLIMNVGSAT